MSSWRRGTDSSPEPPHRVRRRAAGRDGSTPPQSLLPVDARGTEGSGGGAPASLYREADHSCVFVMTRWQRRAHTCAIVPFSLDDWAIGVRFVLPPPVTLSCRS